MLKIDKISKNMQTIAKEGGILSDQLITAKEAAMLLNVSRPTFTKIAKQFKLSKVLIGSRQKYSRSEILAISKGEVKPPPQIIPSLSYTIVDGTRIQKLESEKGVFDLREVKIFDPYGVVSLLCTLIDKCNRGQKLELLIEDNRVTQYLRSVGFFAELEAECKGRIGWDKTLLKSPLTDETTLVPIKGIKLKGNDRIIGENLISLLKKLGFSPSIGRRIAHIIGELSDNTLTHSHKLITERKCFILAKRFLYGGSECIIVGLADIGIGIPETLKTNPKYESLSDKAAFLEAFRPFVSSWPDEAGRGKGLADVISIAWGNKSILRVDTGSDGLYWNFEGNAPNVTFKEPASLVHGTRYGIMLVNNEFERRTRPEVDELVEKLKKEILKNENN
jgi:hypothetical protein